MTPPEHLFLGIPAWVGVYLFSAGAFLLAGYLLYARVFRLVMLGRPANRMDRPGKRLLGAVPLVLGQSKVLQSFSPLKDRAGLAHFLIFWGFLSFTLSYVIFIYGDSVWRPFSTTLLTETGVRIFAVYIEVLAVVLLIAVVWGAVRRWAATPRRLSFDLTQKPEAAIILVLIGGLMVLTLLTEAFHAAAGGGPASAPLGSALGDLLDRRGDRRGRRGGAARPFVVGPPRAHSRLRRLHPHVQARASHRRAPLLPVPGPRGQRRTFDPGRPGDGRDIRCGPRA